MTIPSPTAGAATAPIVSGVNSAPVLGYMQGFATDTSGVFTPDGYGSIVRVPSGTNGITAPDGDGFYAVVNQTAGPDGAGPYTQFGGYSSEFVNNAKADVSVYLDPTNWTANQGFQYSVATNGTDGTYKDEFIFAVRADGNGHVQVGAGPGPDGAFEPVTTNIPGAATVSSAGWYKLEHTFHDNGGQLSVDLTLVGPDGVPHVVATLTSANDATVDVGGNRYGWFTTVDVPNGIAVDDISYGALTGQITESPSGTPATTYTATGGIPFTDVDVTDTHTVTITPADTNYRGTFTAAVSNDTNSSSGDTHGAVTWNFSATDAQINDLAAGQTIVQTYILTVADGHGGSSSQTVDVTLVGANDSPTAANDAFRVAEDSGVAVLNVRANDTDPDAGDTLKVTGVTQPDSGGVVTLSNGIVKFTPAADFNGVAGFDYTISDNHGATSTAHVDVTVTPVNDAPILGYTQGFATDTSGVFTPDGYGSIARVPSGTNGITAPDGDGFYAVVNQTAGPDGAGPYTKFGGYSSEFVNNAKADVSVYLDPTNWTANQGFQYSVATNGTDGTYKDEFIFAVRADGNGHVQVGAGPGPDGAFEPVTTNIPGAAIVSSAGWYKLEHTFHDNGGQLSVDLTLVGPDGVPHVVATLTSANDATVNVGGNRYGWFTTVDVPGGIAVDDISYGALTGQVTESPSGTPATTYTATGGIPFTDVDVTDTHTVTITPVGGNYRGTFTAIISNDTNSSPGDTHGAVTWNFSATDAQINDLAAGQTTVQSYVLTVNDGQGGTSSETVTVTLVGANDAPTITGASNSLISDRMTVSPFATATVADPDAGQQESARITYTAANGTLTASGGSGVLSGAAGDYTVVAASAADLQAALRALVFTPTANEAPTGGSVTTNFNVTVSDGLATAADNQFSVVASNTAGPFVVAPGSSTTISTPQSYTGETRIYGELDLARGGSIASSSQVTLEGSGAVFDVSGAGASGASVTIQELVGAAGSTIRLGPGVLSLTETTAATYAGAIADGGVAGGTGGGLVVNGSAPLTLTGVDTYTGKTQIYGQLDLAGTAVLNQSKAVTLKTAAAVLDISQAAGKEAILNLAGVAGSHIYLGSNSLKINQSTAATYSGVIADGGAANGAGGALITKGTATLNLTGANTFTGGVTLQGGTLELGSTTAAGVGHALTFAGAATLQLDSGALGGTGTARSFGTAISGFASGDHVDLASLASPGATETYSGGILTVTSGGSQVSLMITGAFSSSSFTLTDDGRGHVLVGLVGG